MFSAVRESNLGALAMVLFHELGHSRRGDPARFGASRPDDPALDARDLAHRTDAGLRSVLDQGHPGANPELVRNLLRERGTR